MDARLIQQRIYSGRAKAALRIGLPCRVYRPATFLNPLTNQITIIRAAFNNGDTKYLKPNLFGKPVWFGDFDGRLTQPGDYLVRISDGSTWFIAAQQQLLPIALVECARSIKLSRASGAVCSTGVQPCGPVGVGTYNSLSALQDVLGTTDTPWPASILIGGRVQANPTGLPGDVREAAWSILLPVSVPITIQSADLLTDDLGRRFAVESAEATDLGWRLIANEVHT